MKINLLEFKVKGHLFGIRTEFIKNIFDIENIKTLPLLHEHVVGFTFHNRHVYPLICLESLLQLSKECNKPIGKTVITIFSKEKYFSLIVDEILKIQEIEKTGEGDDIVNFYNLQGRILEEITPEFISKNVKLPPLKQKNFVNLLFMKQDKNQDKEESFLIFSLDNRYFAINTEFVKKVEYIESLEKTITKEDEWIEGAFLVKENVVKAGNLKKIFNLKTTKKEENLIIIENNGKIFSLLADDIVDIFSVKKSEINIGTNDSSIVKDFIVYNNKVVPILSDSFIINAVEKFSVINGKNNEKKANNKKIVDILIFRIGKEKFGIKMKNVSEVLEYSDVYISSYPTENKSIIGIIATERESFFLISYYHILNQTKEDSLEESKILVMEDNRLKIAVLISDIEDILSIPEENIAEFEDDFQFIKGTIITKSNEIINIINPNWIISEFKNQKTI